MTKMKKRGAAKGVKPVKPLASLRPLTQITHPLITPARKTKQERAAAPKPDMSKARLVQLLHHKGKQQD